ncbi:MAG TPA: sigma-70 family RNA polymerase sigma factor [Polyangia bacterium]|jgi:RNA polymerase sigma-70 factor (ECF subfamily)|nr:sigma-70 family RNA polymerase sigma factor [Polyangia bacterium]
MLPAKKAALAEDAEVARARPGDGSGDGEDGDADRETALGMAARAAIAGKPEALREFLTCAAPIVRRVCRGVMGRRDPDLEDAIQDSLIDVARALPQFRFEGAVIHYVTKIAMRRAIAYRQRFRTRVKQHETFKTVGLVEATEETESEARVEALRSLLDQLNEKQAKALLLRVALGHSIDEIAGITGVSVNTVKTRLRLGKLQLRRWLRRRGEVPGAGR